MTITVTKIKLHIVSRQSFSDAFFADFDVLMKNRVNPDDIPQRFYCGGCGVWVFQTMLAMNYLYPDRFACSWGAESRSDAINLMHNDHFGSRVKPWKGVAVVVRADRPPVLGTDYVIEQNPGIEKLAGRIYVPHWPQPGLQPRQRNDNVVRTVAYFGSADSLPDAYKTEEFMLRLSQQGIRLLISFDNWTDYRDVDVCLSFRKNHDHKLLRKPASKLINNWLGKTVMICDDEPSFHAIRESELDYLIAKNPNETFDAIMRLKDSPDLYRQMREQGEKRLQVYSQKAIAARWYNLFDDIWHKGLHNRPTWVRVLRFAVGKALRPLTKKF